KKTVKKAVIQSNVKIRECKLKVTHIEAGAFKNCKKLKSVTIGSNIRTIGKRAFKGCAALKKIKIQSGKLKKVGKDAFSGIYKNATVTAPKKQAKKYKKFLCVN
ncbi:MAG: leucine-rich repeat protein, partial [Lachnospiraceae bacterium]|nr:leucine-rich repeat protein [Lachnospiraceae bacterium]